MTPYEQRVLRAAVLLAVAIFCSNVLAAPREIALRQVTLELPGPPASVIPADLDGDGRKDLLLVVVYTEWDRITTDRIEGAVQVMEVVPALSDRREARAFLVDTKGGYRQAGPPLPLPASVLSLAAGPPSLPILALTDDGLSVLRLRDDGSGPSLSLEAVLVEKPVLTRSGSFIPDLDLMRDVDGDGKPDLLFPAQQGLSIFRGSATGFAAKPASQVPLPADRRYSGTHGGRAYPLPRIADVDGDRLLDLTVWCPDCDPERIAVLRGTGEGRFGPAEDLFLGCLGLRAKPAPVRSKKRANDETNDRTDDRGRQIAYFGDIDGDGRAEIVTRQDVDTGKSEMNQVKQPKYAYQFHRLRPDLAIEAEPYQKLEASGHPFSGGFMDGNSENFVDLDGDGRKDLITVTLDFSMLQALRVLTTKKIGIGLEFHVYVQGNDGAFRVVPDQKLDEKLHLDLNRLEITRMAQFAGDFDGDGRTDFVHLGRGKTVTIHRGMPGCSYHEKPDLTIGLEEEPQDLALVRVSDLDGDNRADLSITRPLPPSEPGVSAPVRLELRLSGGAR